MSRYIEAIRTLGPIAGYAPVEGGHLLGRSNLLLHVLVLLKLLIEQTVTMSILSFLKETSRQASISPRAEPSVEALPKTIQPRSKLVFCIAINFRHSSIVRVLLKRIQREKNATQLANLHGA